MSYVGFFFYLNDLMSLAETAVAVPPEKKKAAGVALAATSTTLRAS